MHRARHLRLSLLLCALASAIAAAPRGASAASVPGLYTVIVPTSDPEQAAQDALRSVLVRLTGSRAAAADPLFASLIAAARRYVQIERSTTTGDTQVLFDADGLRAAVEAAGGHVWNTDRPVVWVALPPSAPTNDDLRTRLTAAAASRGLPLSFAEAVPSGADALESARRAGAAAALWPVPGADGQIQQWILAAPGASGQWSGSPEAAIDATADTLANASQSLAAAPVNELDCHIEGVTDLPSFTDVLGEVGAAPGVMQVELPAIDGDTLTVRVTARGSAASLARALRSEHLRALDGSGDALNYIYQRGP